MSLRASPWIAGDFGWVYMMSESGVSECVSERASDEHLRECGSEVEKW